MNKKTLKEYRIWKAMKSRCYSPSQTKGLYKKLGIKVCEKWLHDFNAFLEDMGSIPADNYSIERIDFTKDYCPENCIWIPQNDQSKNRSNSLFFIFDGQKKCLKDWSRYFDINYTTLYKKIKAGIPFETAIQKRGITA